MPLTITDPEIFWSSLRDNLLEVIPADTFRVWFDNIRVGRLDEDGCELITPNEFSAIWIVIIILILSEEKRIVWLNVHSLLNY